MIRYFTLFICVLLISGCAGVTPPTRFLELSPQSPLPLEQPISQTGLSIGLGPISLPDVLDRPQIVTRVNTNQLNLADFNHWAGELEKNVYRVLQQNLMALLETNRVAPYPWPRYRKLDYQISLQVLQFDGRLGEKVQLQGLWTLLSHDGEKELLVERYDIQLPINGEGYEALAATQSKALNQLSKQIAQGLDHHLLAKR